MDGGTVKRDRRGMGNLVGIVLLVGLTLVGAVAVVVVGSAAMGAVADQTEDDTTEDSMREMSARLGGLADSSVDEATSFRMEGDVNVSSATITIEAQNSSGSHVYTWDRSLGTILYEQSDGDRLAYQGGGLWRAGDGRTAMINEPGIDYDGSTLDLSIVNVSRFSSVPQNGEVIAKKDIVASRNIQKELADSIEGAWTTDDGTVPVDMTVTIESQYADGWAQYARNEMTVSPANVVESGDTVELVFTDLGSESGGSGAGGPTGPGGGGGPGDGSETDYEEAMYYDEDENAIQVNQDAGNLTLMTAQIGEPVTVETEVEEEYRDPMDVVFAIDETGSMEDNDPTGERISATGDFIDSLNESNGDRAGYVQFTTDDDDCWMGGYCFSDPVPQHEGVIGHHEISPDLAGVKSDLESHATGGTNISRGIEVATTVHTNESDPNEERVMVVLTDGQNSDPNNDDLTVGTAERAHDEHNITVYTVGLSDEADEELLEDVAREGGGSYYHADNADQLEEIFDRIANETRMETVHQINRTRTVLRAEQNETTDVGVGGNPNINNPNWFAEDSSLQEKSDLTDLQPGGYLSFTLELQSCDEYETTDVESTDEDTLYRHTYCTDSGTETTTIDNSTADHVVFRDGDAVSELSDLTTDWWHSDPTSFLGSYTDGGAFDLSPEESIIALDVEDADGQSGYVLLHFEVEEIEGGDGSTSDPDDSVAGGDAPRQPITIGYSEVGVS